MNTLCLSTDLSSAELAAWVQAIGSILAIIAAFLIAYLQSRVQHKSALKLYKEEHRYARITTAKSLYVLSRNCAKAVVHSTDQLKDREAIYNIAEGSIFFDLEGLRRIDAAMTNIPLHNLPDTLVSSTMIISSTLRQFITKIEMALRFHRQMDSAAFEDLFRVFEEMTESLKLTCKDIEDEINRIGEEL